VSDDYLFDDFFLDEALFPLAGDLDLDVFLDLEGEREREAGGPRETPDAARLDVVVFRGLGVAGLLLADDDDFFAFFGLAAPVAFFAFVDGLRALAPPDDDDDGLRPRPLPLPLPVADLLFVFVVLGLADLLLGFFPFVTRAGDLLRLLRTFFSAAGFGFDFFSVAPAFLAAVGDKRKLCLF